MHHSQTAVNKDKENNLDVSQKNKRCKVYKETKNYIRLAENHTRPTTERHIFKDH